MFDVNQHRSALSLASIAFATLFLTAACESTPPLQAGDDGLDRSNGDPALAQENVSAIEFLDSQTFDRKVSRELAKNPRRTVVAVNDQIPLSQLPARLDNWLSAVDNDGGAVEVKAESSVDDKGPKTRSMLAVASIAFSAISKIGDYLKESIYDPAKNYDATIYYKTTDSGTRIISSIVFTRKR